MTVSILRSPSSVALPSQSEPGLQAIGLMIAMVVPAVFWTVLIASVGDFADVMIHPTTLWLIGTAIAAFAGTACAPLIFRHR